MAKHFMKMASAHPNRPICQIIHRKSGRSIDNANSGGIAKWLEESYRNIQTAKLREAAEYEQSQPQPSQGQCDRPEYI